MIVEAATILGIGCLSTLLFGPKIKNAWADIAFGWEYEKVNSQIEKDRKVEEEKEAQYNRMKDSDYVMDYYNLNTRKTEIKKNAVGQYYLSPTGYRSSYVFGRHSGGSEWWSLYQDDYGYYMKNIYDLLQKMKENPMREFDIDLIQELLTYRPKNK